MFTDHVSELWGDDANDFLDWLAHVEQKPGVLPHFGWVHISRTHGTGRNWLASVLTRVWTGHVAASLDLIGLLEGKFNDRLSRCLVAIVDEVNEGGNAKYRHADTLRQMITPELREINPKYGRRRTEYNAARWLIFSNHTGALPLDEHDRRLWIVSHEGPVKSAAHYSKLYALLNNHEFIASVAEFLKQRDIAGFNPGQRPPMNTAKRELIEITQSEQDRICREIAELWPVDVITADEMNRALDPHDGVTSSSARHAMDRADIRRLKKVRTGGRTTMLYAVRDYTHWSNQTPKKLKQELTNASDAEKARALDRADE